MFKLIFFRYDQFDEYLVQTWFYKSPDLPQRKLKFYGSIFATKTYNYCNSILKPMNKKCIFERVSVLCYDIIHTTNLYSNALIHFKETFSRNSKIQQRLTSIFQNVPKLYFRKKHSKFDLILLHLAGQYLCSADIFYVNSSEINFYHGFLKKYTSEVGATYWKT